jgi:hypothetical protein
MEVGEDVKPPELVDLSDDCPFDHELEQPPKIENDLVGKGSTLASSMNSGRSTKRFAKFAPSEGAKKKWGKLPQKNSEHAFFKGRADKGRCVTVTFSDDRKKNYPVSCSAHHLVPSQESLKDHPLLQYMCKIGTSGDNNHGYGDGAVWSDVGYDTNGSENGLYLPGNYAVGGGRGGLNVWYPVDGEDDSEHDEGYIDADKLPDDEYQDFLLDGKKGEIKRSNVCWQYVAQATLKAPGQFHDRHFKYSDHIVKQALQAIFEKYKKKEIDRAKSCGKCQERIEKLKGLGLPSPYSVVMRLENLSNKLRNYLTAAPGSWRGNVFTSAWTDKYMQAVKSGGSAREEAEAFEKG